MNMSEIVAGLYSLSNRERFAVIEIASQLIREDLALAAHTLAERARRLQAAALAAKDLYEPGGELAELTDLHGLEGFDETVFRRSVNQAAYRRLKPHIDQTYPNGRFIAIDSGEVLADAATLNALIATLKELGKDSREVLAVQAGAEHPRYAALLGIALHPL